MKIASEILPNSVLFAIDLKFSKPERTPSCAPFMTATKSITAPILTDGSRCGACKAFAAIVEEKMINKEQAIMPVITANRLVNTYILEI